MTGFSIPSRPGKPRSTGRTNLLDSGTALPTLAAELVVAGEFIDLAKIGWGTALILSDLDERIALYREHRIDVCCGGTMFEYAYLTGQLDAYRGWMQDRGIGTVEVSDGTVDVSESDKLAAIESFAHDFTVLSEVGSKDSAAIVSPARWVRAINSELGAGASSVILEGRESGNAGLYRASGEMRTGLVDEILESGIDPSSLVFEAPVKPHQVYLLETVGSDVNLANVALSDAIPLETLRLGLRSDTLLSVHDTKS